MNNKQLRDKYGDGVKTSNYNYPTHFFSPWDDFTMHIPNWNFFLSEFVGKENLLFLELGTANGRSGVWTLENILQTNGSVLYTVDLNDKYLFKGPRKNWHINIEGEYEIDTLENLKPYIENNKCKFFKNSTDNFFVNLIKDNFNQKFDFVYIDASHDSDFVLRDSINSFNYLKTNGLILFDDYAWGSCSIGIDSFLNSYKSKVEVLYKDWQVLIRKIV